uniref:RRM domain-containing protein n=1 Tax=Opuntia streptacantha TaxID=393608 RepID=A0A7C9AA74_OPUST
MRERESVKGREENRKRGREFSVFVYNLPRELDQYGLQGIFQRAGRVSDTYIPAIKGRRDSGRFGFVRYRTVEEATRSIHLFHGAVIRAHKLHVARARPKTGNNQLSPRQKKVLRGTEHRMSNRKLEWKEKREVRLNKGTLIRFSQEEQPYKLSLVGQTNEENEVWLRRSLVCTSAEPRDLATLSSAIMYGFDQYIKLSALSSLKFLLTFPTEERMDEAFSQQEELHQWFTEVKTCVKGPHI